MKYFCPDCDPKLNKVIYIDELGRCIHCGEMIVPPKRVVKVCPLCGRGFDKADYAKTMRDQAPSRYNCERWFGSSKYCGLYCAWLSDPSMVVTLSRQSYSKDRREKNIEDIKNDIAKRVAEYLMGMNSVKPGDV